MQDLIIAISIISAAAVALGLIVLRASANAKDSARYAEMVGLMREKERTAKEAEAQSKALQLYSLQATLDTIRAQAEAQSRAQEQTALALSQSIEALKEDRRTVETLAGMRWKALEAYFTAALPDKQKAQDRYWERSYGDY